MLSAAVTAIIFGTEGDDVLVGGAEADVILGLGGNDTLDGRAGNATLDGGAGLDTASYTGDAAGVTVDLSAATATDGFGDTDTLSGIEFVTGSAFDDSLTGAGGLFERFTGMAGNDVVDGGAGLDVVDYAFDPSAVTVNLGTGTATDGFGDTDSFSNVEGVEGSAFADTLIGGADDSFERFVGQAGNDLIDGATGFDEVSYFLDPGSVTVNLASGTATDGFGDTDTLRNIEGAEGSQFDDLLAGNALDNDLFGLGGFDVLRGGAGSDFNRRRGRLRRG